MRLNPHLVAMPGDYLFAEVARRVQAYAPSAPRPIIRLGIGDVTQPLAPAITQAMVEAAQEMGTPEGFHGYPPDQGYPFLQQAIIDADYAPLGVRLELDEVFVTDGAKTDTSALPELLAADARIGVTDPVYPAYIDANAMAGRLGRHEGGAWSALTILPCRAENDFVPELPAQPVDMLYLCYPNNPTGTVLTREQLTRFVRYAQDTGTLILFDAAYKAYITDPAIPRSIYEIEGADQVPTPSSPRRSRPASTASRCRSTRCGVAAWRAGRTACPTRSSAPPRRPCRRRGSARWRPRCRPTWTTPTTWWRHSRARACRCSAACTHPTCGSGFRASAARGSSSTICCTRLRWSAPPGQALARPAKATCA